MPASRTHQWVQRACPQRWKGGLWTVTRLLGLSPPPLRWDGLMCGLATVAVVAEPPVPALQPRWWQPSAGLSPLLNSRWSAGDRLRSPASGIRQLFQKVHRLCSVSLRSNWLSRRQCVFAVAETSGWPVPLSAVYRSLFLGPGGCYLHSDQIHQSAFWMEEARSRGQSHMWVLLR